MERPEAPLPTRMSDVEALMWTLEADPHLSSNFANITFLDRAPDLYRLRRRLWRASRVVPLLRMRVVDQPGPQPPRWEEDPAFDLAQHVRRVQLPAGADDAAVRALATDLAARPFDRDRPLWEFVVVEGLPDGRAAMVQKMHHTITDGEGGIRMSIEFIDLSRDAPEPPPVDDGPADPPASTGDEASPARRWPAPFDLVAEWTRRGADTAGSLAEGLAEGLGDVLRDPGQLATYLTTLPAETAATARSLVRQMGVVDGFRSPLWTDRSLGRALETFDISLADAKDAGHRLGVSVNDLFVAAAAGGAGRYHRDRGQDVDELRISMPVSTRTDRAAGGNAFTPTRVLVPVTANPRRRLAEIHDRLGVTKAEKALSFTSSLAGLANILPPALLLRVAHQQVATVDFATSNVRAAPFDLFIAGARMEANYPIGPIAGTAWNVTTMSYRGVLNVGVHVDTAAVADPAALARDIQAAFQELLALPHQ